MTTAVLVACFAAAGFSGWQLYSYRRDRARESMYQRDLEERWLELLRDWMYSLRESWHRRDEPHEYRREREVPDSWPPPPTPPIAEDRTATALAAILIGSLTLAAATALVDAKLGDASKAVSGNGDSSSKVVPQDRGGDGLSGGDSAAFDGEPVRRVRVKSKRRGRGLCLIRYAERKFESGDDLSGRWWTSCRRARRLSTVEDVKDELALPARFGAVRDVRVRALVRAGTRIVYFEGPVAPQCEHADDSLPCEGHRYGGGGWQYLFPRPQRLRRWIAGAECTREREDRASRWRPCAG